MSSVERPDQDPSRKKQGSKKDITRETLAASQRALGGLAGVMSVEQLGMLQAHIAEEQSRRNAKKVTAKDTAFQSELLLESGITSKDIVGLQKYLDAQGELAGLDKAAIKKVLTEKMNELAKREKEKAERAAQEAAVKRQEDRRVQRLEAQRKRKRKIIGRTTAAMIATSAILAGGSEVYGLVSQSRRDSAIAYENTHTLGKDPSAYSYSGWRVQYPNLPQETEYANTTQDFLDAQVSPADKSLVITRNGQAVDTGITASKFTRQSGAETPKLIVNIDNENAPKARSQDELLADPSSAQDAPEVVLFEHTDGGKVYVAVKEIKEQDGDIEFLPLPVTPITPQSK